MKNKLKEMKNSVAKIIAMLLVIMVCAAQVNIPVFADVVIRGDAAVNVEDEDYEEGDVIIYVNPLVRCYAYLGGYLELGFSCDDLITGVQIYEGSWSYIDVSDLENLLEVQLLKNTEVVSSTTIREGYMDELLSYGPMTAEDFLCNFSYKILYKEEELASGKLSVEEIPSWNAYRVGDTPDFDLYPGETAKLEVCIFHKGEEQQVEDFSYQWRKFDYWDDMGDEVYVDIEGATGPSYEVDYLNPGEYVCDIFETNKPNNCQRIGFNVYQVTGLNISTVGNRDVYVTSGEGATFEVNASSDVSGVSIRSYQWYKISNDGSVGAVSGATSNRLVLSNISEDAKYYCEVTDSRGVSDISTYFYVYYNSKFDVSYTKQTTELKLNQAVSIDTKNNYLAYPFTPTTSGRYVFYTTGNSDPMGYIIDSNDYIKAYNDDTDEGLNFRMEANLVGGQTYYLAIRNYDGDIMVSVTTQCADHTKTTVVNAKDPTCTTTGYTGDKCCTNCGGLVTPGTAIPATGHSFGAWTTTKAATPLAEGEEARTCTVCGAREAHAVAKLAAKISVNARTIPLKVKQSTTAIKVTYTKGDGIKSWKTNNKKVATVTSKGKITGKKVGTAKITITLKSGKKAVITVKVQKKDVATTKIAVNKKSVSLKKGKSFQLKATVTPVTSKQKVTYTTSNKKIATVTSKGKIVAKKKGKATITVKSGKKTVKVKVTVK